MGANMGVTGVNGRTNKKTDFNMQEMGGTIVSREVT